MKRTIFLQDENAVWLKGNLHSHSTMSDGKLSPEEMKDAYKHRESEVIFGMLPTPSAAEGDDYRCFNWSGVMCVPNTVENNEMVEKTFEGSLPAFIAAFTKHSKLSEDEINEVQKMIDRFRKENTK